MDINYDRCNVSNRLRTEIGRARGNSFWDKLKEDLIVPSGEMEARQCSSCMHAFLEKLQRMLPVEEIKSILVNVRHDLRQDDFDWAVRLFNRIGNIDQFSMELQKICTKAVVSFDKEPEDLHGQTEDRGILEFVQNTVNIFYGRRYGSEILAQAIPYDVPGYRKATNDKQRRYALCHCQFARESILQV